MGPRTWRKHDPGNSLFVTFLGCWVHVTRTQRRSHRDLQRFGDRKVTNWITWMPWFFSEFFWNFLPADVRLEFKDFFLGGWPWCQVWRCTQKTSLGFFTWFWWLDARPRQDRNSLTSSRFCWVTGRICRCPDGWTHVLPSVFHPWVSFGFRVPWLVVWWTPRKPQGASLCQTPERTGGRGTRHRGTAVGCWI